MTTHYDLMAFNYRRGYYNACDGKGWQKQTEGLSVEASTARDDAAWDAEYDRRDDAARDARTAFVVGQCISTLAEYEALPVGATVWPWDQSEWYWVRTSGGYHASCLSEGDDHTCEGLGYSSNARVIRSLP